MDTPVYGRYSQTALDREYDNRTKTPGFDFEGFLKRCAEQSERARQTHHCVLDVPYGMTPAEKLDIFIPANAREERVDIFFHGGYWRMLDKADFSYVANGLVPHGVVTVIANYGLIPSVSMDELVTQCRRAVRWTFDNIGQFGGSPDRVSISGHSAGGHLVAMMMAADWRQNFVGACAISGIYDLEPIRLSFLNRTLGLDPQTAARNSPILLQSRQRCELLVCVGDREGDEYLRQSSEFARAWGVQGVPTRLGVETDHDHFTIREVLGDPDSDLVQQMLALGRH